MNLDPSLLHLLHPGRDHPYGLSNNSLEASLNPTRPGEVGGVGEWKGQEELADIWGPFQPSDSVEINLSALWWESLALQFLMPSPGSVLLRPIKWAYFQKNIRVQKNAYVYSYGNYIMWYWHAMTGRVYCNTSLQEKLVLAVCLWQNSAVCLLN